MDSSLLAHPESNAYKQRAAVSMLNYGADFYMERNDSLINKGTGRNYGIELTLEKFFSNNYYFLTTISLFDSKYKTPYAAERNTVFNGNFVVNALGGYEFNIGKDKILAFDLKAVWAGGKRKMDIDMDKSIEEKKTVYKYDNVYTNRYPDYLRFDLKISFKQNKRRFSQEYALDLQNVTNRKNIYMEQFNYNETTPSASKISNAYQLGFNPMMTYRITF